MSDRIAEIVAFVQKELAGRADPEKAAGMKAYMKSEMPFYGVQKPGRVPIVRYVAKTYPPVDADEYAAIVSALWGLPHREEKYVAQGVAVSHRDFMVPDSIPLYRRFIVEGAWWDFVDETATHMIRELVLDYPDETWPVVDRWVDEDDMWLRRTAILCQVGAKGKTDTARLFDFCGRRMEEKEFFIRKAIGWALREYAKTDPDAVAEFVTANRSSLSGLSYREATKHIKDLVQ